ncbi:hypothetical protein MSSAC_1193 [Methanosarcina siciliae C2J]|uniref:Uncharacterized protein n=2 Tax=Methanosarcina siciliae TaxID=38027 RepID=A0A0E3PGB9_9EURY|nr:hypothetical protein MSSIH_2785 [Methanosarcina siciliae HI350]AKB35783.1 hypothetical protein MSSAC_1193 [Methanosarcina siciliae C2J]
MKSIIVILLLKLSRKILFVGKISSEAQVYKNAVLYRFWGSFLFFQSIYVFIFVRLSILAFKVFRTLKSSIWDLV